MFFTTGESLINSDKRSKLNISEFSSNNTSPINILNNSYIAKKKELHFDMDSGKYFLTNESNSDETKANIFGKKLEKLKLNHTGIASYESRIKKHTIDKLTFDVDNSLYRPQTKFFEGYSPYPRPLSKPFINIEINPESKNKILNNIKSEGILTQEKNRNLFNQLENNGLYFYSGSVSNLSHDKNKKILLKKINRTLDEEKKNLLLDTKNEAINIKHKIKALSSLRKKLIINSPNKINGRVLEKPQESFFKKYKIINNVYFNNPILKSKEKNKYMNKESQSYVSELYNILDSKNKIKKNKLKIKPKIKLDLYFDNKEELKDIENNIQNSKKLLKHIKNNDQSIFSISPYINDKKSKDYNSEEEVLSLYKDNIINKKIKKIILNQNIKSIKTLIDIKNYCNKEKKMLKGFIKPEIKEEGFFRRHIPKYNSVSETILKELEISKLVNPRRFKLDMEREKRQIELINKQIEKSRNQINSNNNSKNVIRIKKHNKIERNKSNCFSTSNILSKDSLISKSSEDF